MHIPDGVLSTQVCVATGVVSAGAVGYSLRRMKDLLADRVIPLTGMMAALIFAGQMVNFPLVGLPVSGHLLGAVLAAAVLGPWGACVAMTLVLVVQCVLFADGGLVALGANVLHMAVVGGLGGWAVYWSVRKALGGGPGATLAGAVAASWLTVMAAATLFCVEFVVSWWGTPGYDFRNLVALMVSYHSLIGLGEAVITGVVLAFILKQRPDLLYDPAGRPVAAAAVGRTVVAGVIVALAVAAFLSPFASTHPDGLEAVAARTGFDRLEATRPLVFEDYAFPFVPQDWQGVAVALAGVVGTLAVLVVALVLGRLVRPASREDHSPEKSDGP